MFNRILLVFVVTVFHNYKTEGAPVVLKSRQLLPPLPGYIPVYIRNGDTPLEDINLELAEAFRSYAQKHARFNSIRARSHNVLAADEKRKPEDGDKLLNKGGDNGSFGLDEFDLEENGESKSTPAPPKPSKPPQHIQKIKPRS